MTVVVIDNCPHCREEFEIVIEETPDFGVTEVEVRKRKTDS
jgi:hypothetical protein